MKKVLSLFAALLAATALTACGSQPAGQTSAKSTASESFPVSDGTANEPGDGQTSSVSAETDGDSESPETVSLDGHTLSVFCGAGMTKPFQKIADAFQAETGCEMAITFANAGQIQTQINTAQEGDLFIAGSEDELKPVQDMVSESTPLVKHIPVLAVQTGNPKGITGLADLADPNLRVVLGDAKATPIGKIADKALSDAGLKNVNVVARTTTAPAIFTALQQDECDAAIVWKENVGEGTEAVATPDMEPYEKTIPAASLTCSADPEALEAFLNFLDGDKAKEIWTNAGYVILN